jgi:molybdate transport system ATP-binding protein
MTALAVDATTTVGTFTVVARFDAGPGITALFGPSGSGKSVTLATIAGLVRPTAGTIAIGGRLVADAASGHHTPTQARGLGMVLQRPTLLANRSPVDNVALAARGRDRAGRRRRALGWLERVGAGHLADARTTSLSGGEQQRVALARALVGGPSVLLLDEPFSALDLPTRTALRRLVTDLVAEQDVTAVIVSHDVEDVTDLAHQVVLFEPGRTVATHRRGPGPLDLTALLSRGTRGS